ncbi:MAG: hypothetical protein MZV64_25305 [Ignavibacteriales bacterium]|nr:hypothetical protein [Ignavibacteriales bacterium]
MELSVFLPQLSKEDYWQEFQNIFHSSSFISIGAFCMMIGLGLIPFGGTFLGLSIIVIILSLGTGSLQPTLLSLISEVTSEAEQGITLGFNQSLSAFARVLGPLWGGFAFEYLGYPFPFITWIIFQSCYFNIEHSLSS